MEFPKATEVKILKQSVIVYGYYLELPIAPVLAAKVSRYSLNTNWKLWDTIFTIALVVPVNKSTPNF